MAHQGKQTGLVAPGFKTKRDTSANRSIAGAWSVMDGRAIAVHQERCAKVRNRNVMCLKCAEACTSGCISLVEDRLAIDPTQCVGCGTCATVCPTSALEAHNPTDAELLGECVTAAQRSKAFGEVAEVAIGCQPVREALVGFVAENAVVPVVCVGRVDESLLLGLVAQGVQRIHILCGDCEHCAQKYGFDTAHRVVETAHALLKHWSASAEITAGSKVPACALAPDVVADQAEAAISSYFSIDRACSPISAVVSDCKSQEASGKPTYQADGETNFPASEAAVTESLSRACIPQGDRMHAIEAAFNKGNISSPLDDAADKNRESVSLISPYADATSDTAASSTYQLLRVMKDGTLPHFIPDRRERLLDALACLPDPTAGAVLATRLWGTVFIDAKKCSSCRLCATFCPTEAIRKFDLETGEFGIDHTPADCVNCGSCRDICPEQAITLRESVAVADLLSGTYFRYRMVPRAVSLRNNPHQIVDTFRQTFNGDIFER